MGLESGLVDKIVSLAGVNAKRGLASRGQFGLAIGAAPLTIAEANPYRAYLSIVNTGAGVIRVVLGDTLAAANNSIALYPRGSLEIDRNLPWTGFVDVETEVGGAASTIDWCEVSVLP